jgi:hypothetical protein
MAGRRGTVLEVTFEDVKTRQDNWFQKYTMTIAQNEEWQAWGKKYLQKNLREREPNQPKRQMQWFSLQYGLKFSVIFHMQKNKMTAVEYLEYMWTLQGAIYKNDIEKAQEMEKQRAIDFGYDIADRLACGVYQDKKDVEELYIEFFKSE